MRWIDPTTQRKFESKIHAGETALTTNFWLGRPTTPLTQDRFLERQTITTEEVTKTSIAVSHPALSSQADRIYVAYISNGQARVKSASYRIKMQAHTWVDEPFVTEAEDIAICFDSRVKTNQRGIEEFITQGAPWVFWVHDSVLKARRLGYLGEVILASDNCSAVSAIRAAYSETAGIDFGLIVFFVLNGTVYYRQLIDNDWKDAEIVIQTPAHGSVVDIAAFRTWDYRIGLQLRSRTGNIYRLLSQYQGIAKRNSEHIELALKARGNLTDVNYIYTQMPEHLELDVNIGAPYGGLYRIGTPSLISVENIAEGIDWGRIAIYTFDRHLRKEEVAANPTAFQIVDSLGGHFVAQNAQLLPNGKAVRLSFLNFNGAIGECTAQYVPGDVHTMADAELPALSLAFTPRNLVPPSVPAPVVTSLENNGNKEIIVTFSAPLTGSLSHAERHFTVHMNVPEYSPGGVLVEALRRPGSVTALESDTLLLTFLDGNLKALNNAVGDIVLEYDGAGPLMGEGGPVYPFSESFTPTRLTPKYDSSDAEHLLVRVRAEGELIRIYHSEAQEAEHLSLGVRAEGELIHIKDI